MLGKCGGWFIEDYYLGVESQCLGNCYYVMLGDVEGFQCGLWVDLDFQLGEDFVGFVVYCWLVECFQQFFIQILVDENVFVD